MEKASTRFADFDISEPNIIKITLKSIDPSLSDVDEYIDKLEHAIKTIDGSFILLLNGESSKWINGKARIEIGKRSKKLGVIYRSRFKKNVFVAPNAITKMMLKATNVVLKPEIPQEVFSDYQTAFSTVKNEIANW